MATAVTYGTVPQPVTHEFRAGFDGYHVARFNAALTGQKGYIQIRENVGGGVKSVISFGPLGTGHTHLSVYFRVNAGDLVELCQSPLGIYFVGEDLPIITGGVYTV